MSIKESYIISDKEPMERQESIRILRKVIKDLIKGIGINKLSFELILKNLGDYRALRIKDIDQLKETFNEVCNIDNLTLDVNWDSHKENIEKFTRNGFIDFAVMFDPYLSLDVDEKIDIDGNTTGIKASERNKILLLNIIKDLETKIGKEIPIDNIISQAKSQGLEEHKFKYPFKNAFEDALERLKRAGEIYEPKYGVISLI